MQPRRTRLFACCVSTTIVLTLLGSLLPPGSPYTAAAASASERVEVEELRTATSRTFLNADGTYSTQMFAVPLHYRSRGKWVKIDSSLVESAGDFAWENAANSFAARFGRDTSGGVVEFDVGGAPFVLTPQGSAGAAGKAKGSSVSYPGAFPGVDLEYGVLPDGIKETLVLHDANAPSRYRFFLSTSGGGPLEATPLDNGSWEIARGGDTKFLVEAPFVLEGAGGQTQAPDDDATPSPSPEAAETPTPDPSPTVTEAPAPAESPSPSSPSPGASPGDDVPSTPQEVEASPTPMPSPGRDTPSDAAEDAPATASEHDGLEQQATKTSPGANDTGAGDPIGAPEDKVVLDVKELDGRLAVDLRIDEGWLRSSERSFPILVDPTMTIPSTVQDASFNADCPTCTGYRAQWLYLGTNDTERWRSALQFDLGDIPAGATVTSAQAGLYFRGAYSCFPVSNGLSCGGNAHKLDAHVITSQWLESSTTADIAFDSAAASSFTLPLDPAVQWMEWDLTSTVESWLAGTTPNFGILLKRETEPLGASGPRPWSRRYTEPTLQPRLEVTWSGDGVTLLEPTTLHSNGAELSWTTFAGTSFSKYEIHRSSSSRFTPSDSTRIATITDPSATSYRDSTAAASKTFSYKVVTNAAVSNERTVTLPAEGYARKLIQPGVADGKDAQVKFHDWETNCRNYGRENELHIGPREHTIDRALLSFDLSGIGTASSVTESSLSLWHPQDLWYDGRADVHRVTSSWNEGSGFSSCTGDGATWYDRGAGTGWLVDGADYSATPSATLAFTTGDKQGWDRFDVTGLVQAWVDGTHPNHGVVVKTLDETRTTQMNAFYYWSSDFSAAPTLRPKLEVTYLDGSKVSGPSVAISSPTENQTVSGEVQISAAATDDGRVANVDFLVGSTSVGSDTSAPYELKWNSQTVANGPHQITAVATDDAGNTTTSGAINVTVDNSALPTTAIGKYRDVVTQDGPVGFWRLGDPRGSTTATDSSGNAHDGSYVNVAPGAVGALANDRNTAVDFPKTDEVNIPDHDQLDFGTSDFTVEAWVKTKAAFSGEHVIASKTEGDTTSTPKWRLTVTNDSGHGGEIRFAIRDTSVGRTWYGPAARVDDGNWHYVAVAVERASGARLYVDGLEATRTGATSGTLANTAPVRIGDNPGDSAFNGWIDEVALYDGALSAQRLSAHRDTALARLTAVETYAQSVESHAPVGWWRLGDASTSTTAQDSSGNAYDGTYRSGTTPGVAGSLLNDDDTAMNVAGTAIKQDVEISDRNALDQGLSDFTVEAWVKTTAAASGGERTIMGKWDGTGPFWALTMTDDNGHAGEARITVDDGATASHNFYGPPIALNDGNWHHVVAVVDRDYGTHVYVDGVENSKAGLTGWDLTNASSLRIGDTYHYGTWAGDIDEAALYHHALTAGEAKAHYDAGRHLVTGAVTVSATASDDEPVARVDFYVDGIRFAEDSAAPYNATWDTLAASLPAYDGPHQLMTRAVGANGQVGTSEPVDVVVANAAGTPYQASFDSTAVPSVMLYDPAASTQEVQPVEVTVTNDSATTWSQTDVKLHYRWYKADNVTSAVDSTGLSLPADVAPGQSATVRVDVSPPALADGSDRARYKLRFDLKQSSTGTFFGDQGNLPLDNWVIVNKAIMDQALGLERYYHYEGEELGAGMSHMTNVASGNSLLRWTPFMSPGRGLSTVVDLTYNSLEDHSESPVGNNFSLSVSSLTRLGLPLDVHPNKADEIAGRSNRWVAFTDGDGTTHRFEGKIAADGTVYWEEPAGVHLWLRTYSTTDPKRKWALTRPDRVTFFYDEDGYPTGVEDGNGNTLEFTLEAVPPAEDPGGVAKRIVSVTDAAGLGAAAAPNRSFSIDYYSKAEASKPQIRGKIERITDHNGSALVFDYYEDGNLLRLTQKGGTKADDSSLSDRSFVFTYTTSSGDGPAIPTAADRVDPDPKTSNQSTRLFSVRDPRGNETTFSYYGPTTAQLRGKLSSRTARDGHTTSFAYDLASRITTVSPPAPGGVSRDSKFHYDVEGKVVDITNAKNQVATVAWTADRHVAKVYETRDTGAALGAFTEFAYNDNGYLTDKWDQLRNHTAIAYENLQASGEDGLADARDASAYWEPGRTIPHLSQASKVTDARDHDSTFTYDGNGNVETATDAKNFTTSYSYDGVGNLISVTDANDHATTFADHDGNGFPQTVTDAANRVTEFSYDADGLLRWVQSPAHSAAATTRSNATYFDYDSFHRFGRHSTPYDASTGKIVWSGVDYDRNDNVVTERAPDFGTPGLVDQAGAKTDTSYDAMDRATKVEGPSEPDPDNPATTFRPATAFTYDAAGRIAVEASPKGNRSSGSDKDFATFLDYDALDRVVRQTRYAVDSSGTVTATRTSHLCYDVVGDLVSVTAPRAAAATVDCSSPPSFTTNYDYDAAHRLTEIVFPNTKDDGSGARRTKAFGHDANGNITSVTDENGDTTTRSYDARNMLDEIVEPFTSTRSTTTKFVYDPVGNLKTLISPRAWDASADKTTFTDFVTKYDYDPTNLLTRVVLPTKGTSSQYYIHRTYDADGRVGSVSLPTSNASSAPDALRTDIGYFDTGWVKTTNDHVNPKVTYDYEAHGWQTSRSYSEGPSAFTETWAYFPDGTLQTHADRKQQQVSYFYDPNNNIHTVDDFAGKTKADHEGMEIRADYNGFDEVAEIRHNPEGDTSDVTYTTYDYDLNGNVKTLVHDGRKQTDGSIIGRKQTYSYDEADWLAAQRDWGKAADCKDDQWIDNVYSSTGKEKLRTIKRPSQTLCTLDPDLPNWETKQTTAWTYHLNDKLKTLVTKNASGTVVESHDVDYLDDLTGEYVNGHRTQDVFTRQEPQGTSAPACATTCTLTYRYDPLDRVEQERRSWASNLRYDLDSAGNVVAEYEDATLKRTLDYSGTRLDAIRNPAGSIIARHFYDVAGNLDCVTTDSGTQSNCAFSDSTGPAAGTVVADYSYDDFNRLELFRRYDGQTTTTKSSTYTYDVLDRLTEQKETHGDKTKATSHFYLGLTRLLSKETIDNTDPNNTSVSDVTKTYAYDAHGHRISMTNDPTVAGSAEGGPAGTFTYGYDVHGSVSMLLGGNDVEATYGYTAYGTEDAELSNNELSGHHQLNPFRYSARRYDEASESLDMGARRFGPDTGRFLTPDFYQGALSNLGLSADPLTGNRYSLAAGNPVSFVETDGHMVVAKGGGGGSTDPDPDELRDGWESWATGTSSSGSSSASSTSSSATAISPTPQEDQGCFDFWTCAAQTVQIMTAPVADALTGGAMHEYREMMGQDYVDEDSRAYGNVHMTTNVGSFLIPGAKVSRFSDDAIRGARQITILGENMHKRVKPFARGTGARTLRWATRTSDEWARLPAREKWKLNDGLLRARIREGDTFRTIGQDPERMVRDIDLLRSELLRLTERGIPYETVAPDEIFKVIGRF